MRIMLVIEDIDPHAEAIQEELREAAQKDEHNTAYLMCERGCCMVRVYLAMMSEDPCPEHLTPESSMASLTAVKLVDHLHAVAMEGVERMKAAGLICGTRH